MRDRSITLFMFMLLALATLACNAFAGRPQLLLPPTIAAVTPGAGGGQGDGSGADLNLAPTVTVPAAATPLPDGSAVVILTNLNVRGGPGVGYERLGYLDRGQRAPVVGRDAVSGWWQIVCPADIVAVACWVSGGSRYTRLEMPAVATPTPTTP